MTFTTLLQNRPTGESYEVQLPALQIETILQSPRFQLTTPATYIGGGTVFERLEVRLSPLRRQTRLVAPLFKTTENLFVELPSLSASVQCLPLQAAVRYSKRRQADEDELLLGLLI